METFDRGFDLYIYIWAISGIYKSELGRVSDTKVYESICVFTPKNIENVDALVGILV